MDLRNVGNPVACGPDHLQIEALSVNLQVIDGFEARFIHERIEPHRRHDNRADNLELLFRDPTLDTGFVGTQERARRFVSIEMKLGAAVPLGDGDWQNHEVAQAPHDATRGMKIRLECEYQ